MNIAQRFTCVVIIAMFPALEFAQTPPLLEAAPSPSESQEGGREDMPKTTVTFLGVKTSKPPTLVSNQLGLPADVGAVVDFVVPDSPAAAADIRKDDIIKMIDDHIMTKDIAKVVRNYPDGANVTVTLLREGKEKKVSVRLAQKEVSQSPTPSSRKSPNAAASEPSSLAEWMSIIEKDCNILLVELALGKPDSKGELRDYDSPVEGPCIEYGWFGKVDYGTTHPGRLALAATEAKGPQGESLGVLCVVAIKDPESNKWIRFSWARPRY